ncbi:male-specific lethal 2-like protein [Nephila pilipes]|uniref:Male-specific lethal 2-like protein n=1 Tax=Nephila pilipes TaxID=299642 RepID=A0A8X6TGZ3_NEPPI|nr:male-specific lethal 2-like protein [Nephila pilipes]
MEIKEIFRLYTKTVRMALDLRFGVDVPWTTFYESFCQLRKALLCEVCSKLVIVPYQRYSEICVHFICRDCLGGRLASPCIWCVEDKKFEDNVQIRILLQCYKKMCIYILACDFYSNSEISDSPIIHENFMNFVTEGSNLDDDYSYTSSNNPISKELILEDLITAHEQGKRNSFHYNAFNNSLHVNRKEYPEGGKRTSLREVLGLDLPDNMRCRRVFKKRRRRSCRCGTGLPIGILPKEIPCRQEKCPCFAFRRSCFNCRCQGCKNPRKPFVPRKTFLPRKPFVPRLPKYRFDKYTLGLSALENVKKTTDLINDHASLNDEEK